MRSYLASQLIGTIWFVGGIIAKVESPPELGKGALGMIIIAGVYYLYSIYLWGRKEKQDGVQNKRSS